MRNILLNKIVFLFGVLRGGLQGRKLGVRGALKNVLECSEGFVL